MSGYLDSVVGWQAKNIKRYRGLTFSLFLDTVLEEAKEMKKSGNVNKMFIDWRPYHHTCNFCQVEYTVISKTESFEEDKIRILRMVGERGEEKEEKLHVHTGSKIQDVTKKLFQNVSEEVKEKLLKVYKYEFALFDYDAKMY